MDSGKSIPEDETIPDVPMILSAELYDVFPIFASMLDIKSFMRLAMTSKEMYKRCTEDKSIRISVNDGTVGHHDGGEYYFHSSIVSRRNTSSFLEALEELQCTLNLRELEIGYIKKEPTSIKATRRFLLEIGVKRIEKLCLCSIIREWDEIVPFVKDFLIEIIQVWNRYEEEEVPLHVLRSLLQINLKEFVCWKPTSADLLLETAPPIQKLSLMCMENIPKDKFMQILWMIQTGPLLHLEINMEAVDWSVYDTLPFNQKEPLPEDRPLLLTRKPSHTDNQEYWFLHWQEGVTKCVRNERERKLEVFKCDPHDYPHILRKEEDILKDLSEMRTQVFCLLEHFRTFSSTILKLSRSFKGALPVYRPLYIEDSETSFWRLDEEDNMMSYSWEDDCATLIPIEHFLEPGYYPLVAKYMFWKRLKKCTSFFISVHCEDFEEFNSLFEDYKLLDRDFMGPLPEERPLVFNEDTTGRAVRTVLFTGPRFQCTYERQTMTVHSIIYTQAWTPTDEIYHILKNTSRDNANGFVDVRVDLQTFRDGVDRFLHLTLEDREFDGKDGQHQFLWTKTTGTDEELTEECWYSIHGTIMKATWKDGRLIRSPLDIRDFPTEFLKELLILFARRIAKELYVIDLFLEEERFRSCLEQLNALSFDYSGPLKRDYPLVFVKEKIRHTCGTGVISETPCQCTEVSLHAWFLWEDLKKTWCTWRAEEPQKIQFSLTRDGVADMPPALKSNEYLTFLLKCVFVSTREWFGSLDDLAVYFKKYKMLPFNYKRYLPRERPLVFKKNDSNGPSFYFLRDDDRVVECILYTAENTVRLSTQYYADHFWKVPYPKKIKKR